ncbi:MAG: DNA polymerase III subunit gamma/tau [Alphaproteobacteria bacterium]|nr:DNA polymerase III subunit gamma/tau [Alphaproteobacteria bacterium]
MKSTSHVLARKYRPQVFKDLVGQEALVQTITNAIEHNRLAHAYMLTGIRGVGKTSSARIIAKGLNCIGPDGTGSMTPNPCGICKHCQEIAADSHIDVIEIDAASNTGVDNIREIIESAKYNPVSARFKIYIIDEVHMLSKAAFNALLKTLEEPPERIKFILATTEIRKVPITILSRCQRFDLKRLDENLLTKHLQYISAQENIQAEEEALRLIARAGDGSCRDSLSLLDQAMTQFNYNLKAEDIRQMLGVTDRTSLFDLYDSLMHGDVKKALDFLQIQYASGSDPMMTAQDLLSLTHWLTRVKIIPELANDHTIPEAERTRGKELANNLSMATLTSTWQILLKGLNEIKMADNPLIALEMVLIRLAFLSEIPPLGTVLSDIKKNTIAVEQITRTSTPIANSTPVQQSVPAQTPPQQKQQITPPSQIENASFDCDNIKTLKDISNLAKEAKERLLAFNIETYIRPISIEKGKIVCAFTTDSPRGFSAELAKFLTTRTGIQWEISIQQDAKTNTLKEDKAEKTGLIIEDLKRTEPLKSVLSIFPKAQIGRIKEPKKDETEEEIY